MALLPVNRPGSVGQYTNLRTTAQQKHFVFDPYEWTVINATGILPSRMRLSTPVEPPARPDQALCTLEPTESSRGKAKRA